jgi:hypothetical protein
LQLRVELGIADHVWQEKRDAIAQTVGALVDEFKPAVRAGWMAYIRKTYPVGRGRLLQKTPLGKALWWLTMIESGMLMVCMLTYFL